MYDVTIQFADFPFYLIGLERASNFWEDTIYELCRVQTKVQSFTVCHEIFLYTTSKRSCCGNCEKSDLEKGQIQIFNRQQEKIA